MLVKSLQVLVLILGLGLSFDLHSSAQDLYRISSVSFIENGSSISGEQLHPFLSVLGFISDNDYSEHDIVEGARRVENVFNYRVVKWNLKEDGQLVYHIARKNKISGVFIEGNNKIRKSQIHDVLGQRFVGSYCEDVCIPVLNRLRQFYEDQGFFSASIDLDYDYRDDSKLFIYVIIEEGPPTIIDTIDLEVKGFLSIDEVKRMLSIRKGQRMISSRLNEKIRGLRSSLYSRGFYASSFFKNNVQLYEDKTRALVELGVNTGPKFAMRFIGNEVFSSDSILRSALDINETDVLSSEYYPILIRRLEDFYKSNGFSEVRIEVEERIGLKAGELILVFNIDEGSQKYLGRVNFNLSDYEQERRLRSYLRDRRRDFFSDRFFIRKELEDMKQDIERFFNEEGYLRVRVIDVKFEDRGAHLVDATYDIDVGRPTMIRGLNIVGNTVFSDQEILEKLKLERGGSVSVPDLSEGLDKLMIAYRELGYVDYSIDRQRIFSYSDDFRFVDINIIISEGRRFKVGRIFIQGLSSTKERVVTRELRFNEGDDLDLYLVQYSENELSRLSVFSSASLIVLPSSIRGEEYRDVMVSLEEKKAGIYELGFGYRTDRGVRISSDIIYHNLGGWNRRVNLGGAVSRKLDSRFRFVEYEISAGYYEPYLFNIPFDFRTDIEFRKEDFPDYGRKKLDLAFYFEKRIGYNFLILRQAFERVNIFGSSMPADDSVYWKYSIRPTYRFDNRDSFFNPTRGIHFMAFAEWGHSLSGDVSVNYIKLVQRTRFYISLSRGWTFLTAVDSGYVKGLRGGVVLQDERFAMGGIDSIRGYRWRVINDKTPRLPYQYYYTFTAELRRQLFWRFVASVFHDYGNMYSQDPDVQGPFSSVGSGLSLVLPVGAISLQYGYIYEPGKRIPPSKFGRVHFSIGTF